MNLSGTRAAGLSSPENLITNTRIFMFRNGASSNSYYKELLNLNKSYNTTTEKGRITAPIEVGEWQLSCVGAETAPTLQNVTLGAISANTPMYKYTPTVIGTATDFKSENAEELFTMYFGSNGIRPLQNGIEM